MPIVDTLLVLTGLDGWFPALLSLALLSRRSNDCLQASLDPTFVIRDLGLVASFSTVLVATASRCSLGPITILE